MVFRAQSTLMVTWLRGMRQDCFPSFQGADLTFTVAEDGSAWVNGAKILFTNVLLFNGVAHIIDT
jgi:uncharacterized surface protein with fasciclin (FAS1) repeats